MQRAIADDPERCWQKVLDNTERTQTMPVAGSLAEKRGLGPCWMWTGKLWRNGYFGLGADPGYRVIYSLFVGPIKPHMNIDHLCKRKACANPKHYEQVTGGENTRRSKLGRKHTWDHRSNLHGWTPGPKRPKN